MFKKSPLVLSDKTLRHLIELSPQGISLPAIASAFDLEEAKIPKLKQTLQTLMDEGFCTFDPKNQYRAAHPMSEIVVVRVKSERAKDKKGKEVQVLIEGVPDDFPFRTYIKASSIRTKFGRDLSPNEPFAVVVSRRHGNSLVATKIIGRYAKNNSPSIVGTFNKNADMERPCFTTKTPGVSGVFKVSGHLPQGRLRVPFHATVPIDLDPFNPRLHITEQKWDPVTGENIALIIAKKHGLDRRHSRKALIEAKSIAAMPVSIEGRRDLTMEKILVIDPKDARDHDDGIMIERTHEGYRTLVVVSDVPYFIRPGTHIDFAAQKKGFTHYFPDDTFHMLPERVVKTASLSEGQSKPVIYVEQFWDLDGNKVGIPEIGAGIVSSQKQMTYGEFEDLVTSNPSLISSYIELGDTLVQKMRFEKVAFDIDDNNRQHSYSQMLVAAMMIEANSSIAEFLLEQNIPFLSRSHTGSDNVFAFEAIKEKLEAWGYELPDHISGMSNEALRRIIAEAERRDDKQRVESAIRSEFLNRAIYSMTAYSHFGLNREVYAHATSPIRRYADNLVLRGVHTALGHDDLGLSQEDCDNMHRIAIEMNSLQNVALRVARDVTNYYAVMDLQRLEGHFVRAVLGKIDDFRAEIILPERSGLRHYINLDRMPDGWGRGKIPNTLIYKDNVVTSGAHVRVRIEDVKPNKGQWGISHMEATFRGKPKLDQKAPHIPAYTASHQLGIP